MSRLNENVEVRLIFVLVMGTYGLRADVSYFLCFTRKGDVCVTPSLIVFQYPAVFFFPGIHAVLGLNFLVN